MGIVERIQHGWNAFVNNRDPTSYKSWYPGSYSTRPDRPRFTRGNEKTILTSLFNKIAVDVAAVDIRHVRLDKNGRYKQDMISGLNDCLTLEANIDQTGRALVQDIVMSMLDEGCVAVVPVDTSIDPSNGSYDIQTLRTGKIIEWRPADVKVRLYNDQTGQKQEIWVPKRNTAIIENPLYAVINEPNSTVSRLKRKLALLDSIDEQVGSGKIDMIIQLPYVIKTPTRKEQAEERRRNIEEQLSGSKYGIAYTDGTEKITQLNRPLENNLLKQIEYLMNVAYSQIGFHQSILDGTADETTMLNYNNSIIEPILSAIVLEFRRKYLTKTARTQLQSVMFFRDPFRLVPIDKATKLADTVTRNEIMSSNEVRQKLFGLKPSDDPKADQLINSNINQPNDPVAPPVADVNGDEEYIEEGG